MVVSPWYEAEWRLWKLFHKDALEIYRPTVSVIIPAWNEEVGVLGTINSLLENTYPNIEIVVINDGSTDNSDASIKAFIQKFESGNPDQSKKIIYHYKENEGKGPALNTGLELATGEIIMTIDADCIVEKNCVQNFVAHFADPKVMAAVGNVKIGNSNSLISTIQYMEFLFSFYFKRADSVFGSIYIIGGAAGAFRKNLFEKIGNFSTVNITEDIELSIRIQAAGMKIVYAADAIVYTEGADTLKSLMNQRLRWKRGRLDTFIKYKNLFFSTHPDHNKFLSWFVLPFAVFGDTQLLFEIPFVIFLYITAYLTHNYAPFISSLLVVMFVFLVQIFTQDKKNNKTNPYILAPIGWIMFYLITLIELNALVSSFWSLYRNKEIKWQTWKRIGLKNIE